MNKPSIFYWIICVILLLWNAFGGFDFIMTQTQNEAYMASYPQEMLDYWYSFPLWVNGVWGLAVFGALIGWILMLLRKKLAVTAFLVSFVGMILTNIYSFFSGGFALQAKHLGAGAAYGFTALIIGLAVFAIWYSRRADRKGYLS